jgi:uncharacterized membrane protein YqjE
MHERPGYATLFGRIRENARQLLRRHIELPKAEIAEIVQANLGAVKLFAVAAALGLMVLVALVFFVVALVAWLLSIWLPYAAAIALATFLVLFLFGALAAFIGWRGYKSLDLRGPTRSIEQVKETVAWAKAHLLGQSGS